MYNANEGLAAKLKRINYEEERVSVTENEDASKIAHMAGAFSKVLRKTMEVTHGDGSEVQIGAVSPSFDQS